MPKLRCNTQRHVPRRSSRVACLGLICALLVGHSGSADAADDADRRLALTTFPGSTKLLIDAHAALTAGQTATLHAGVEYTQVSIDVQSSGSGFDSPSIPMALFVPSTVAQTQARAGVCAQEALGSQAVAAPYGGMPGANLSVVNSGYSVQSNSTLTFLMGGSYRLCYSDDASFAVGHGDTVDVVLSVNGVFDNCLAENCLANKPYYCHVRKLASNPAGSCVLSYAGTGKGFVGSVGKATWSMAYSNATYSEDGQLLNMTVSSCGSLGGKADEQYIGTDGLDRFITPTSSSGSKEVEIPQTLDSLDGAGLNAFAVSACYCPDLGGCDAYEDFTQQIGVIYFFLSKVCATEECAADYLGVLPKVPFLVKVECPPGACSYSNSSRIKLVDSAAANNLPHWSAANGCRTALNSDEFVPSGNCQGPTDCEFDGGLRQDYKVFPNSSQLGSFTFLGDPPNVNYASERYDLRHIHAAKILDVCFCESGCSATENWFTAGQFRTSPLRLVGHSAFGQASDIRSLEFASEPGILGFSRPAADADSIGLNAGGLLKILSDNQLAMNDELCASTPYDDSLVAGPSSAAGASSYAGAVDASAHPDRLIFNSGFVTRTLTVNTGGVIAVCYCAVTANSACVSDGHFKLAGRLTVKGPAGGQAWQFSTNVISRISYLGWGLESSNKLRILVAGASCSDNSGNPTNQDPAVHVGCPGNCKAANNFPGQQTEIATQVLAYDKVGCDRNHAGCSTAYLTSIDAALLAASGQIQDSATQLTFSADPALEDGDVLTLGDQITGGTEEQRAAMRGVFPYADAGTYIVGLHVSRLGSARYRVPVGWIAGSTPSFSVTSSTGQWTRHNKATTKEELLSTSERDDLKICWSPGGTSAYAAEVGTVSFSDPPNMPAAALNLVSPIPDQSLPVIVSFETGARSQYSSASSSMELRFLFTVLDFVQVDFADGSNLLSSQAVEPANAQRSVCGQFFKELWSSDGRGFPFPKTCYYSSEFSLNSVKKREIVMVFESQSGLAPSTKYQAVFSATVRHSITAGDEVVQVFAMEDQIQRPYQAVELGRGKLSRTPMQRAYGASPQLAAVELEGTDGVTTLNDHKLPLEIKLSGSTAGPLVAGAHLRLIFYPLTLWSLSTHCVATCTPASTGQLCGEIDECATEAVVANASQNIAHLKLPQDLTPVTGAVTPKVALWGLNQPDSGFFPVALGAQVTDVNDLLPQFQESTGTHLFKQARNKGHTIASVVMTDGNSKPFRGSDGNDLFIRIAFGATLYSKVSDEAYFVITLPTGYTCVSASAVQASLGFLDLEPPPQRRGTLSPATVVPTSDGAWKFTDNICRYFLWQNSAIYAGSIAYVKLTVDNPSVAMAASDDNNQLKLSLHSRGAMTWGVQAMPEISFGPPVTGTNFSGSLSSGVSVLGKLSEGLVQPMDFTPNAQHNLHIFFVTDQAAGEGAYLHLDAPEKFDFGLMCAASDLSDDSVYVLGVVPATNRLPGISGCTGSNPYSNAVYHNRAVIQIQGALSANSRYALQVGVTNPAATDFSSDMLLSWRLALMSSQGHALGETDGPLHFQPHAPGGWGLYQRRIDTSRGFNITLSSYQPYSLIGLAATVSIFPIQVSAEVISKLRIIAPYGYTWIVSSSTAKYRKSGTGTDSVQGATADLPGELPTVTLAGSTLEWAVATYDPSETYGFIAQIRVPDTVPPNSTNSFFIEFGDWDSGNMTDRHEAGVVHALDVRALQNAAVTAAHHVEGVEANLTLQIKTITSIPRGGGLSITTPTGFDVPAQCVISGLVGLPSSITCTASKASDGTTEILLSTSTDSIQPGTHRLKLTVTNPSASVNQQSSSSPCGFEHCWVFQSLATIASAQSVIDRSVAAPSYNVYMRMPSAGLAELSQLQRLAIHQNRQPMSATHLVFFLQLAHDATGSGTMHLVGPAGFSFHTNCLDYVETRKDHIFGGPHLWPEGADYEPWPTSVNFTKCEGNANTAVLQVESGLKAQKKYPWRIQLRSTPAAQPIENMWTIVYNGESSVQFSSFDLWSFYDLSLRPLTLAQSPPVPLSTPTINPIILEFRPHNTVNGGLIRLQVPPGFKFVHQNGLCDVELRRLPKMDAGHIFSDNDDFRCEVDVASELVLSLYFAAGVVLSGTNVYELTMQVQNPNFQLSERAWMLQSFQSKSTSLESCLDMSKVDGFPIVQVVTTLSVVAVPSDSTMFYNTGLLDVQVFIRLTTPSELKRGDVLRVTGPSGFDFSSAIEQNLCNQFSWEVPLPHESGPLVENLQTEISCSSVRGIEIMYDGSQDVAGGSHVAFHISTVNPRKTPTWIKNYWSFEHRRGEHVVAAGISVGYNIIPQLEETAVELIGPLYAAQAASTIRVKFRVVSDCDLIRITAVTPLGFDMTGATLVSARSSSPGGAVLSDSILNAVQVVPAKEGNSLDVQVVAKSDQAFEVVFSNVKLATYGGATEWMVQTFNSGVRTDERTVPGFRLPGLIRVLQTALKNELADELAPSPRAAEEIALLSKWTPRVSKPAVAEFTVRLTNAVPPSAELRITTDTDYELRVEDILLFPYNATGYQNLVNLEALSSSSGTTHPTISMKIMQSLFADTDYVIVMLVRTASNTTSIGTWQIELLDGAALPLQTNDGQTAGFELAEVFDLQVTAPHAPFSADVEVTLSVNLGKAAPTILRVIPPGLYNFPSNCTVSADVQCISAIINGVTSAYLSLQSREAFDAVGELTFLASSPSSEPASRTWILEGLLVDPGRLDQVGVAAPESLGRQVGWGENRLGFVLTPMGNIKVRYATVPLISTCLSITFQVKYRGSRKPSMLRVIPPISYRLSCAAECVKLISLPAERVKCKEDPLTLSLSDGGPFPEGVQVFTLGVRVPSDTPQFSDLIGKQGSLYFQVLLLDNFEAVVDSDMTVDAMPVQPPTLQFDRASLTWTSSSPGEEALVSFGFRVKRSLPAATAQVGYQPLRIVAILLEMPDGFQHLISAPEDVTSSNNDFPVSQNSENARPEWAQYDTNNTMGFFFMGNASGPYLRLLRVLRDEGQRVPVGTYSFSLPVQVPTVMPQNNVWYISLCSSVTCSSVDDASVVASFVIPGFIHGQVAPETAVEKGPSNTGSRASLAVTGLTILFLLHMLTE